MRAGPHILAIVLALEGSAQADRAAIPDPARSPANQDGLWITLGPVGGASRIDGEWYSSVGGELSVLGLWRHGFPALVGLAGGGVSYQERPGGRIWLDAEVAMNEPLPFAIGLAVGAVTEVDAIRHPRFGVQGTLWVFAGVVPYARVGRLEESGTFLELGLMIKIPVRRVVSFR